MPSSKVFITYAWDQNDVSSWVKDLAVQLSNLDVDVTLDQWHAEPGDQLPLFMEKEIARNDYILIVCSPKYKEKSNDRTGG